MIILEKPYISEFLKETIRNGSIPVVDTGMARESGFGDYPYLLDGKAVRERYTDSPLLYITSENAIGWIGAHLAHTDLPEKISLFKDKVKFRQMIGDFFPDFYYKEVALENLGDPKSLSLDEVPFPFIIKPSIGFFSMGVYKVDSPGEWPDTLAAIRREMADLKDLYPGEVMDSTRFIIEQCIEGREFAMDAYFDGAGEPVVLNILEHIFASATDVSDRVYITSEKIIRENLDAFTRFLRVLGRVSEVKNFPVHVEVRKGGDGTLIPIEVNAMRFGGWCTTGDIGFAAYGINPYDCYFNQKAPDWASILTRGNRDIFGIVVLDNSTGFTGEQIASFDYDRLLGKFDSPLELRKIDYAEYPVFGFVFTRTKEDNFRELEKILRSDLREFIVLKPSDPGSAS